MSYDYVDMLIKRDMPYRKVYELNRKDKDGFVETIWCFERRMPGWRATGAVYETQI